MLKRDGINGNNETHLTLHVPEEHCMPGLEVKVQIRGDGIAIGGELIEWGEVEIAKLRARGCEI